MSDIFGEKYIGTIRVIQNKYAFIDKDNVSFELDKILNAFDKDLVEYQVIESFKTKSLVTKKVFIKRVGQVTAIKRRNKNNFVIEVTKVGNEVIGKFENKRISNPVTVKDHPNAFLGEKILIKLISFAAADLQGSFISSIGHKDDINVDVKSIIQDLNIATEFSSDVDKEAQALTSKIEEFKESKKFKDLTSKNFFTVDPSDSKDFDDAICVERINGSTSSVYVAISDVWSYLKDCPKIEETAIERGTSVYLLNSVIPMIPFQLSNNLCSLVEGEERNTLVVNFLIDEGKIRNDAIKIFPAIIKSKKRFNYDQINDHFNKKTLLKNVDPEVLETLDCAYDAYKKLERTRNEDGYLNINRASFKFELDENNNIEKIINYKSGQAQKMIEVFMVYANLSVGMYCAQNNLATIYRHHDYPETKKIKKFLYFSKELNFYSERVDLENLTIFHINKWLQGNQQNKNAELITTLLLHSMQKAVYSTQNTFHFGLNLNNYLHFTSPIRRYPDLAVHKVLWMNVFDKDSYTNKQRESLKDNLSYIAETSTASEIKSSEAESSVNRVKILKYLMKSNKTMYSAVVVGRHQTGLQVKVEGIYEIFIKTTKQLQLNTNILVKLLNTGEFDFIRAL